MSTQPAATRSGQEILAQMGKIPVIVQGKLSERRSRDKVTGYKLQRWRNGRNQTRHVPADRIETVRRGTQGYSDFVALAQQYVEVREKEAFLEDTDSKKKPTIR